MTPELENKLREKYPGIFNNMFNGHIECRDGWYALIEYICKHVQYHNEKLTDEEGFIRFDQIKEKFGALRVYVNYYENKLEEIIRTLEGLSTHICEECGRPGNLSSHNGWYRTRCVEHELKIG